MKTGQQHSARESCPPARILAALGLAVFTAGCRVLNQEPVKMETRYYLLTPTHALTTNTVASGRHCMVRLRPVEVADYLNTRDMAVRTGTNEIKFASFHCWAEPLDSGIRRVLAENLRSAPAIREVVTDQPAPAGQPVFTIWVRVLACEGIERNSTGSTALEAAWQITGPDSKGQVLAHGVFRAEPRSWTHGDYGELAAEMSRALSDFSGVLLTALNRESSMSH